MGFSYTLKIGGVPYYEFGDLKTRESVDGLGMSGVCTQEFLFTLSSDEYNWRTIPPTAEAVLYLGENYLIASGFISVRKKQGGKVSFTCYDRMAYTDQVIIFGDGDFTNNMISSYALLGKIQYQCGFEDYGFAKEVPGINVPREKVEGKTGREILEILSAAWCGIFRTPDSRQLVFVPFEEPTLVGDTDAGLYHAAITERNSKGPIEQVVMTNGSEEFKEGNTEADVFKTVKISSELASAELANDIFKRIGGMTYQAWDCSKLTYYGGQDIALNNLIRIKAEIKFKDGVTRTVNHIEKSYTAYGIFSVCGSNDFSESEFEYLGALSRKIANKISDGEELANKTMLTRYQGYIHLAEKENSGARSVVEPVKRYGYAPATYEGVVKFDGALVDKTLPEITVKDDLSGFSTAYGNTVIEYALAWNGDNVTLQEKETVK